MDRIDPDDSLGHQVRPLAFPRTIPPHRSGCRRQTDQRVLSDECDQSSLPQPVRSVRPQEGRATLRVRRCRSSCRRAGLRDGTPSESGCGPRRVLGRLLQRSHTPEPQHRPLASSERQGRVLGPVVHPPANLTVITSDQLVDRATVRSQPIRHNPLWQAVPHYPSLEDFESRLTIPRLGDDALEDLTLVIDSVATRKDTPLKTS